MKMRYEVEKAYREMVEKETNDFYSHHILGMFLRNTGRYDEAKEEFSKALKLAKISEEVINNEVINHIEDLLKNVELNLKERISAPTKEYQANVMINLLEKKIRFKDPNKIRLLDIGTGRGEKIYAIARHFNIPLTNVAGIDISDNFIQYTNKFFRAYKVDLEKDTLPFNDEEFDLIIFNQVLEHLKNIRKPLNEIKRVMKDDGFLLIGTPNLSSLYDRCRILIGKQPTVMKIPSTHIRGFTPQGLKKYLEENNFRVIGFMGNGFYPLPIEIGRLFARYMPSLSIYIYYLLKKK